MEVVSWMLISVIGTSVLFNVAGTVVTIVGNVVESNLASVESIKSGSVLGSALKEVVVSIAVNFVVASVDGNEVNSVVVEVTVSVVDVLLVVARVVGAMFDDSVGINSVVFKAGVVNGVEVVLVPGVIVLFVVDFIGLSVSRILTSS